MYLYFITSPDYVGNFSILFHRSNISRYNKGEMFSCDNCKQTKKADDKMKKPKM